MLKSLKSNHQLLMPLEVMDSFLQQDFQWPLISVDKIPQVRSFWFLETRYGDRRKCVLNRRESSIPLISSAFPSESNPTYCRIRLEIHGIKSGIFSAHEWPMHDR